MNWLVLLVGLGLGAMWVVALITGGVVAWFFWLTLVAAVVLVVIGAAGRLR